MPVNPGDFLRAFVLAVTERLQRGESASLPAVGTWSASRNERTGRVEAEFSEETEYGQVDPALALSIALELGTAQPEITARLSGFARAVASHLAETGSVLVPGIGRLSGSPGQVTFRPEPLFAEAVDWDRPDDATRAAASEPTASEEQDGGGLPAWEDGPESEPVVRPTPPVEPDELPDETAEPDSAPESPEPAGAASAVLDSGSEAHETASDGPADAVVERSDALEPAAAARAAVRARAPSRRRDEGSVRRRSFNPVIPLAVAAFLVVAATIIILVLRKSNEDAFREPAVTIDSTQSREVPAAGDDTLAVAEDDAGISGVDSATTTPAAQEPSPQDEPEVPLTLEQDFDITASGYTIFVGSTTDEAEAQAQIVRYAQLDVPTAVLAYPEDGRVRYRLAVGRYETVAEAVQALETLADRLPEGAWVHRIRP